MNKKKQSCNAKKILWNTKKVFWNTKLKRGAKRFSRNTNKLYWNTQTVYGIQRGESGIPRSFHVMPRSPYGLPRSFYGIPRSLSNTMKLDWIPRSSMEYQGAVQKCQEVRWITTRFGWNTYVNSCPDSGRTELGKKGRWMMPNQVKVRRKCHEMTPKR